MVKHPPANADVRNTGSIPVLGRFPGGGHGNPLWYCCVENSTDKEAWWATVHRVAQSQTRLKWLSMHALHSTWNYIQYLVITCNGKIIWKRIHTHTHNKHTYICMYRDFLVAKTVKNLPTIQETQVQILGWEDPLEKERLATPVFLPREFHGQRSLVGYIVQGVAKSWTQLSDQH